MNLFVYDKKKNKIDRDNKENAYFKHGSKM